MSSALSFQLFFLGIFAVANNFKSLGKFLEISEGLTRSEQLRLCRVSTLAALIIMLVALFVGEAVLHFFGLSLDSFRVAGGLVLAIMGVEMTLARKHEDPSHSQANYSSVISTAIIPVVLPLTTGAGTFSTIIIFSDAIGHDWQLYYKLIGAILLQAFTIYIVFHFSATLVKILGKIGMDVLIRLVGLLTLTLGLQFITLGLGAIFPGWLG